MKAKISVSYWDEKAGAIALAEIVLDLRGDSPIDLIAGALSNKFALELDEIHKGLQALGVAR